MAVQMVVLKVRLKVDLWVEPKVENLVVYWVEPLADWMVAKMVGS
jgi:hypothetical protein